MSYFVIGPDGSKYGPADESLLREWVAQGRVGPTTMLEETATMRRVPASTLPSIFTNPAFAPVIAPSPIQDTPTQQQSFNQSPTQGSNQYGNQYQFPPTPGQYRATVDDGSTNITWAIVLAVLNVLLCPCAPLFGILGIWQSGVAIQKGNSSGPALRLIHIVLLCIAALGYLLMFGTGYLMGDSPY